MLFVLAFKITYREGVAHIIVISPFPRAYRFVPLTIAAWALIMIVVIQSISLIFVRDIFEIRDVLAPSDALLYKIILTAIKTVLKSLQSLLLHLSKFFFGDASEEFFAAVIVQKLPIRDFK